ncbi:MAG: fumarylacetoacetate hydrolase family protein [Bacillota bacterium]
MKIVRYKEDDDIFFGKLENDDTIKRLGGNIFDEYYLTEKTVDKDQVEIINPVDPPNILAVGLNYEKHVKEGAHGELPENPVLFLKATTSVIGHKDNIVLPAVAPDEVDYEAELAVVIGKTAKNIEPEEISEYILGYTCGNDVSARDCQLRKDKQWARGKSFDTFCPLGPWIETSLDPNNCKIKSRLNGKVMQDSNTSDMIFKVEELVSYCSKNMTLLPGTVIMTGTPEGVGFAREPEVFLQPGDQIQIDIEGIGVLKNQIISEDDFQKGSKIVKTWSKLFGTTQLTPHMFEKLSSYMEDGLEEELIVEVIKDCVINIKGNPNNYISSILNDLLNREIYTVEDYREQEEGGEFNEQVQKDNRTKKERTPEEELQDLYKKGYR